jgi:polyhydroxyalkanoate synthase
VAFAESRAEQASFLGYCIGGNLGLLALAGQTLPVRSLVTMATPVDFTALPGLAGALLERQIDPDRLIDWTGNVPAEYLSAFFRMRRPTADVPNMARLWENLWNDEFVESHQAMARGLESTCRFRAPRSGRLPISGCGTTDPSVIWSARKSSSCWN